MRPRRAIALLLVAAAASLPAAALAGQRKGTVVAPVRLIPDSNLPIEVVGLHYYFDRIEVGSASDGLVVVNRSPLERYLLGLNEVPTDWPMEALKAQAIAARTYALWTLEQPRGGSASTYGFDICATVSCQVFSGADVLRLSSTGERWAEAVDSTAGRAVLYGGRPILARYHSTSGGQTFNNETIFTSEGSYPYLKAVPSTAEDGSPLYRWRAPFHRRVAQALLARSGLWSADEGRLVSARSVDSQFGYHYPDIVFQGTKDRVRISAEAFRDAVRYLAPEMFPDHYPSFAPTSTGRLPEVMPSNRVDVITKGKRILVEGRGWGHGVGMSQWGAEGSARAGTSHTEILTHYYTDVEVGDYPDPGPIEVGVAYAQSEVVVRGSFELRDGRDRVIEPNAVGTWIMRPSGAGAVKLRAPRRFGLPLRVGVIRVPNTVEPGAAVRVQIALSGPAHVWAIGSDGEREPVVKDAGRSAVLWTAPETPGDYDVEVVATNGKVRRTDIVSVRVGGDEGVKLTPELQEGESGAERRPLELLAALTIVLGAALLVWRKVTMTR